MADLPVKFKPGFVYRKLIWGLGLGYAYSTYKNIAFNGGARTKHSKDKEALQSATARVASLEKEVAELNQLKALYAPKKTEAASDVAATIVTYSDLEKPDWLDTTVLKLDKAGSENYFNEIPADTFIDAAETASRK
eukprot:TRINITY_DN11681_c0_g1_i1.p1 TRINITY_DN11681_c0_g1~~TRINITY_DN11681_c0_g1_i1.p1  ORF type:complete len:136 (-),score=49.81 TRINITY_DN11681_c0_g1_i1:328-735(-)